MGARVIATSSSDEKLQIAKKLGASNLINYRTTPDWAAEVLTLTSNKGADLVVDVVGPETLEHSLAAVRQGGTVCVVGVQGDSKPNNVVFALMVGVKTCKIQNMLKMYSN